MIDNIDKYVELLCDLEISEHQFLILFLISNKDEKNIIRYKNTFKSFKIDELLDLIDRGYIEDFGIVRDNKQSFNIYDFLVTDKFKEVVTIDKDDAIEELLSVYPKWFEIKGIKVPAINYGDNVTKMYHDVIKNNRIKHQKIVSITKEYHEKFTKGLAQKKIEDYISGRMWILYEEALSGSGNNDLGTVI